MIFISFRFGLFVFPILMLLFLFCNFSLFFFYQAILQICFSLENTNKYKLSIHIQSHTLSHCIHSHFISINNNDDIHITRNIFGFMQNMDEVCGKIWRKWHSTHFEMRQRRKSIIGTFGDENNVSYYSFIECSLS